MTLISNRIQEKTSNFKCEICGIKLNQHELNDLIIFAYGNIGNEMWQNTTNKGITQTTYIHKKCMKLLINKKFSGVVREFFNNSL